MIQASPNLVVAVIPARGGSRGVEGVARRFADAGGHRISRGSKSQPDAPSAGAAELEHGGDRGAAPGNDHVVARLGVCRYDDHRPSDRVAESGPAKLG